MGRRRNNESETVKVTVSLDRKTYDAISLLAFLRKTTIADIITGFVASKKNAISKEIQEKIKKFRDTEEMAESENEDSDCND